MSDVSIGTLVRPLLVLVPHLKRLHAEKSAGENPFPALNREDKLDELLDGALARLGSNDQSEAFWRGILATVQAAYTKPELFAQPSIREWLSEPQVRRDVKYIARAHSLGTDLDPEVTERVLDALGNRTLEARHLCSNILDITVAVLNASVVAALTSGEAVVEGRVRDVSRQVTALDKKVDTLSEGIRSAASLTDQLHTQELSNSLSKVVSLRIVPGSDASEQIVTLVQRMEEGDLIRAASNIKADTYYWAARIVGPARSELIVFDRYFHSYTQTKHCDPEKVRFLEAERLRLENDTAAARKAFSQIQSKDARTVMSRLILDTDGNEASIEWIESHKQPFHQVVNEVGFRNALISLAELGRWEEAIDRAAECDTETKEKYPELYFVEGVIHAAMLVPEPVRHRVLQASDDGLHVEPIEGFSANKHRAMAIELLARARDLLHKIGGTARATACLRHLLWIRLQSPELRDAATAELRELLEDQEQVRDYLAIALEFGVEFDRSAIASTLKRRKLEGLEDALDIECEFRLFMSEAGPEELLSYLERNAERLANALPIRTTAALQVEALAKTGKYSLARERINRFSNQLSDEDSETFHHVIKLYEGEGLDDPAALFEKTQDYHHLRNLLQHLSNTKQWAVMVPYATKMFEWRRSADTLAGLVRCLQETQAAPEDILHLLDKNRDLLTEFSGDHAQLRLAEAFCLFQMGDLAGARKINLELLGGDTEPNATQLDLHIALRTGDWESFPAIADRAIGNIGELPIHLVFQIAQTVADRDKARAFSFLVGLANEHPDNGHVQANAYFLATQLGMEDRAGEWLRRAVEISESSEEGPMTSVSLAELADKMPQRAERNQTINREYMIGKFPIHAFSGLVGMTIAEILLGVAARNRNEADARRRSIIPIRNGASVNHDISHSATFACDYTSLLMLSNLGLVEKFCSSVKQVYVSPKIMDLLFVELRKVRYHQPSRVREAQKVCDLVADRKLIPVVRETSDRVLTEEVGEELAGLIDAARDTSGQLLSTLPIPKAGTFRDELAATDTFSDLIVNTLTLLDAIKPSLPPDEFSRAFSYLSSVDRPRSKDLNPLQDGPIYIDDLALKYLHISGILDVVTKLPNTLFISELTLKRERELVEIANHGGNIAQQLDELRQSLRDAIEFGKIKVLPEVREGELDETDLAIDAVRELFRCGQDVDVVLIDDRSFAQHPFLTTEFGRNLPVAGVADVVRELARRGVISDEDQSSALFRLRRGGFALLPIVANELLREFEVCDYSGGVLRETPTLGAIRENLLRIRSLQFVVLPEEGIWFNQLRTTSVEVLQDIWRTESFDHTRKIAISDWVYDVVLPHLTNWTSSVIVGDAGDTSDPVKLLAIQLISIAFQIPNVLQRKAYSEWLEGRFLEELKYSNPRIVEELSEFYAEHSVALGREIQNEIT